MATILDKLNEKIQTLNISVDELPEKTKRKIAQLKKKFECKLPTVRTPEGKFKENYRQEMVDLIEDIIADAEAFAEDKADSNPPVPPTDPPTDPIIVKKDQQQKPPADPPKKSQGLFDWLWD